MGIRGWGRVWRGGLVVAAGALAASPTQAQVFTAADKQVMLAAHNQVRCAVNPPAQSMPALTWNVQLELTAQTWASLCIDLDNNEFIDHNPNRHVGHPYSVGENIYAAGGPFPGSVVAQPTWAVQAWAAESAFYNYAANTCAVGRMCGHYTQLVSANTLEVGCARAFCPLLDYDSVIVCNYGPAPNYGSRPYVAGSGANAACGPDLIFADGFESD